jgi:hypothetical protein
MRWMTCKELLAGPTLIVLAQPTSRTADTDERTTFPEDICTVQPTGRCAPLAAIGVETTFAVVQVLKGDQSLQQFVLHHYREPVDPRTGRAPLEISGPDVVFFQPVLTVSPPLLLFLRREADGRYAPYGGQTDPGIYSIFSSARPPPVVTCQIGQPDASNASLRMTIQTTCRLVPAKSSDAECGP